MIERAARGVDALPWPPTASGPGLLAITHLPSPNMDQGERTYVGREPIDDALASSQHEAYRATLSACGLKVLTLAVNRDMPDCVFVEDTAVVLDEVAVMMSMGAESRRAESAGIEPVLRGYREIARVELPATIDGGDVVCAGRTLYVGRSPRTSADGIDAMRDIVGHYGYTVTPVAVSGCLHLKSGCSALPDGRFLVNRAWIDVATLPSRNSGLLDVPDAEPSSADVLVIADTIVISDQFPQTAELLEDQGWRVLPVSVSEFAKAEGAVTCLSLVFRTLATRRS